MKYFGDKTLKPLHSRVNRTEAKLTFANMLTAKSRGYVDPFRELRSRRQKPVTSP